MKHQNLWYQTTDDIFTELGIMNSQDSIEICKFSNWLLKNKLMTRNKSNLIGDPKDLQDLRQIMDSAIIHVVRNNLSVKDIAKSFKRYFTELYKSKSYSFLHHTQNLYSFEFNDTNIDLDNALQRLSEADRQIIRLYIVEEYTMPEIAMLIGINANAAHSRLKRAKIKLKEYLQGY